MVIYYVTRMVRKERKTGVSIERRIFAFSPNVDDMMEEARILASRYKRRFVVCGVDYKKSVDGRYVAQGLKGIVAFQCEGKGKPIIQDGVR